MRPFKHVAREGRGDSESYQNILGIDLGRFTAPWGEVPIVATTEAERITLYYWDDLEAMWASFEKRHDPVTFAGDTTFSPASWNWSDRVGVACSENTVYVVYKRALSPDPVSITVDRYQPSGGVNNHRLEFVGSQRLQSNAGAGVNELGQQIGRSLWAACDENGDLLVLFQLRTMTGFLTFTPWGLWAQKIRFNLDGSMDSDLKEIGEGGFDLDARLEQTRIIAVYRATSEAFRIPLAMARLGRHLTSGVDADPFYEPLRLSEISTQTLDSQTEGIPGGEHPQIQRTSPLLITMDRPTTLDLSVDIPFPLPPRRPHTIWDDGRMDKIAWLRDGVETFRGTLLTSDATTLPRSHAAMSQSTHLFEDRNGLVLHASPFAYFPVHVLSMSRETKELVLDVLHHRDFVGLFRTRLRATLSDGVLTVHDRAFEAWDIGHGQIGDPDKMEPSADGETRQFAPTTRLALTSALSAIARHSSADNTIGGHLAADTSREPVGFFAYTDLGDGCLRVVFASDMPATLSDPPPIDNEKVLRPEQVTGPHLACDEWIELEAADFVDSELIGYSVGLGVTNRSLGSALEVPIDFLLDACVIVNGDDCSAGDPPLNPLAGLSSAQLTKVDAFRVKRAAPLVLPLTLTNGRNVTVSATFHDPQQRCPDAPVGALVRDLAATLTVDLEGNAQNALWTITSSAFADQFLPPGPILPGAQAGFGAPQIVLTGNPVTVNGPPAGRWRLSVFIPDGAGNPPGAASDIDVQESSYDMIRALHRGVSRGQFHRIGNLNVSALQYDITYQAVDGEPPTSIAIATKPRRNTELRFRPNGLAQGLVDGSIVLSFSTDQLKLRFGLDVVFTVKSFALKIEYGRSFTAGMLMRDQRSRDALDGHLFEEGGFEQVDRRDPGRHAAIGGKPFGDARNYGHEVDVDVEMTLLGVGIPGLLAALATIGAFGIIQIIVGLLAPAVTPVVAIIGIITGVVVGVAVWILISILVPPYVENFITERINDQFASGEILNQLNDQPIVRYAGEGVAEAIARKALAAARDRGFNVPAPMGTNDDSAGFERSYGQLFQMVFVSDGTCRVLLRLDDCHDGIELPTPEPVEDDDDDGPVVIG